MSVITQTMYACKCDNCGRIHEGIDDLPYWTDKDFAVECALYSGWREMSDGRHICDNCYTYNKDDSIRINKARKKA